MLLNMQKNTGFRMKKYYIIYDNRLTLKNDIIDKLSKNLKYYSPVIITGDVGVGKTNFLELLREKLSGKGDESDPTIYNAETVFNSMLSALRNADMATWRESFKTASVLMIDDFDYFSGKNSAQEEMLSIFNSLEVPIIIATKRMLSYGCFSDEVMRFLDNGVHIHLKEPSHEELSSYLMDLLEEHKISLSGEALDWLFKQNIESYAKAQGIVKTVALHCSFPGNVIDLNECQEIVKPLFGIVTKEYFEL